MHKAEQDRRLIHFLMGLNEVYTVIRGSILMMNPLPSMAQAFALLVQEEKQREFKTSGQMFAEASSMNSSMLANAPGPSGGKQQQFKTNYSSNSGRSRPFCEYCKKLGHTKDKCFKIYGYPQTRQSNAQGQRPSSHYDAGHNQFHKSAKGKGIAANVFGNEAQAGTEEHAGPSNSQCITKDQYNQLLNLLQFFQLGNVGENNESQFASGAVNFAGPFSEEAFGDW